MYSSFLPDVCTVLAPVRFMPETSRASDITYRIYVFNRKDANGKTRELHTDLAREAINYEVLDDYRTKIRSGER